MFWHQSVMHDKQATEQWAAQWWPSSNLDVLARYRRHRKPTSWDYVYYVSPLHVS